MLLHLQEIFSTSPQFHFICSSDLCSFDECLLGTHLGPGALRGTIYVVVNKTYKQDRGEQTWPSEFQSGAKEDLK